ncbi:AAA family ATPase [Breoghania corrubedonensis]|uniref:bifunctional aminoglycoside phosphotransferase/ATP-binding protein n=1 Tax=Breoghania corrubedonensis TaxID=665038 RepID=UPI001FE5E60A|nr:AAA family ATPase [Breoghania corrubedonensis]
MNEDPQARVLALLENPSTYGADEVVTRIDTHAAAVFLAGDQALKLKRAVTFPFLDYSTLELRKAACEHEIEVNRPNAPMIYRDVVAVTHEADGSLAIGGKGEPVDWLVRMNRFDETQTLDRLAENGPLPDGMAEALADIFAASHARAPDVGEDAAERWIDDLEDYVEQNRAAFLAAPELFPPERVRMLNAEANAMLSWIRPLLRQRGRTGRIRRCHGDAHLGNIVLIDGTPVLFDAIEFDDRVATGDVLYDLAFPLMDLSVRGLDRDANRLLNRYLSDTHRLADLEDLTALPFFMLMRACIRAKVAAARLAHVTGEAAEAAKADAVSHFHFAERFLEPVDPVLIAIGGLSGTGKSTVARALAPGLGMTPGAVILRSDVERKLLFEVNPTEHLPPDAYDSGVTQEVYTRLCEKAAAALAAGRSVIVDAVFATPGEREDIAALSRKLEVPCHGFWLEADLETTLARVAGRVNDASDADIDVLRRQFGYDLGDLTWTRVDASGTPEETLARVKAGLEKA